MLSSVGKVFTAVTIAKLIEQKQLAFDTTLGALVPDYPLADARDHVTVGHLLTMPSASDPTTALVRARWRHTARTARRRSIRQSASHAMETLVFGVSASDPLTLAGAGATLALVALMASLVPACRALRLDPVNILRAN